MGPDFDPTKEHSLYPQEEPAGEENLDTGEGDEGGDSEEDRVAALEKRLQDAESRYQQTVDRQQQTIDRLLAAPATQNAPPQERAAAPELPDPVEDPKGFREAIQRQIADQAKEVKSSVTAEQSTQQRIAEIQKKFWTDNSDLSDFPELVDGAYQKEAKRLMDQGIDPQQALLKDSDNMSQRVAETARSRMKELGIGASKKPTGQRTAGVSGGTTTRPAAKANGKVPGSFIDELKKAQAESGYY